MAKNFREIGDQAADLPQEVLRRLGGTRHLLLRAIIAQSEKRIRTLIHAILNRGKAAAVTVRQPVHDRPQRDDAGYAIAQRHRCQ